MGFTLCGSLFCGIIGGKKTINQHFEGDYAYEEC